MKASETTAMPTREEIERKFEEWAMTGESTVMKARWMHEWLLALFSRSPVKDAAPVLTEEDPAQQEVRAWEWISDIIERHATFWVDDSNVLHVNNAPAVAHKIVTDSVTLQLLRPLIDRLAKQAPVQGLRPEIHAKCLRLIEQRIEHAKWGAVPKDIQTAADVAMALIGLTAPQPEENV